MSLAEIAVQTFAVVLGILLALGIDDWKKERETAQNVSDAMHAVQTELESNRQELKRHRDHLLAVREALGADQASAASGPKACHEFPAWSGTGTAVLLDAAYQTAIATQAFSHMEFARAQTVAAAYGIQKTYLDYFGKILDVILRGESMPAATCAGLLGELANFAGTVDVAYSKALAPPATTPAAHP